MAEVRRLLDAGRDPDVYDAPHDNTAPPVPPLVVALTASTGPVRDIVRLLLEAGADPDVRYGAAQTPLHHAITSGGTGRLETGEMLDIVRLLLEAGADPDARDATGDTPLDTADVFTPLPGETSTRITPGVLQRLRTLLQNAGGGGNGNGNGNNAGNNGNGSQTCPAGQTGAPPDCRDGRQTRRGPGYAANPAQARAALRAIARQGTHDHSEVLWVDCVAFGDGCLQGTVRYEEAGALDRASRSPRGHSHADPDPRGRVRTPGYAGLAGDWSTAGTDPTAGGAWGEWMSLSASFRTDTGPIERTSVYADQSSTERFFYADVHVDGVETPRSAVPDFATATYTGVTHAVRVEVGGSGGDAVSWQRIQGDADVTADFRGGSPSLDVRLTNFQGGYPELASGLSFTVDPRDPVPPTAGLPAPGLSGHARFFGPDHDEVGGTYTYADYGSGQWRPVAGYVAGDTRTTGVAVIGAFGARRDADE